MVRLLIMLVTRLVCDREALNSLARVFVFSRMLACQIRVAQEFQEIPNKKHARMMHASVKFKSSGTVNVQKQVGSTDCLYCKHSSTGMYWHVTWPFTILRYSHLNLKKTRV